MKKTIAAYLIDVEHETASVIIIPAELHAYYKALNCRTIDIVTRQIGVTYHNRKARVFDIICDDEALLKDAPKISAIDNLGIPMLCGNLLIVRVDDEGDTVGITPDDVKYLKRFILPQGTRRFPKPYPMLHQCEYA